MPLNLNLEYAHWKGWRAAVRGRLPFGTKRQRVVRVARWAAAQPGAATSYLYGGVPGIGTGSHTDCSGFVLAVYRRVGVTLARTSQQQYANAPHHPAREALRPGDLLCFNYEGPHSHIGIYVGAGFMIADQHTGSGIVRVSVDWAHFDGAASYLP
jgi:cell wall-associated NlpC family hydrolase